MRIFIGHIFDEQLIKRYNLPFAVDQFSRNLATGGMFDKIYTMLATNVVGDLGEFDETGYELVYSDWRKCRGWKRKFAFIQEQIILFRKVKNNDSVWFSNLNPLNFLIFILLWCLKPSVKRNIIVMDFTPPLKTFERATFFLWLANHAHGTIRLSHSELFTVKNSFCLPGVVPYSNTRFPEITTVTPEFLISGALHEHITMLQSLLIPAFRQLPECVLHISGITSNEKGIKAAIGDCKNIKYHGKLSYDDYFRILDSTPFLLSTRNPLYSEHQCNFPSKIIEGLLHNRIIISTMHYPQLTGINYFTISTSINDFVLQIKAILNETDIMSYANQADLVRQKFSATIWANTIKQIEENE